MSDYVIWKYKKVNNACVLYKLSGIEDEWELTEAIPLASQFPENVEFSMHPDFPNNTLMIDNLQNSYRLIVASNKLKEFLESKNLPKVEYLPIIIKNHKGKIINNNYFIIHPIDPVDCMNLSKSKIEWGIIDEKSIDEVENLVLDENKIDPERKLFRLKYFYDIIIVHKEFAKEIDEKGFEGIRWIEIEDFST